MVLLLIGYTLCWYLSALPLKEGGTLKVGVILVGPSAGAFWIESIQPKMQGGFWAFF